MQSHWLTQTKFIPPRLRQDLIQRSRLLEMLSAAVTTHPLILISAPAGYGKTTLMASFLAGCPALPVAWISLDEEDNDPVRFLTALVTAWQRVNPAFGANIHALLASLTDPASETRRVMGVLINEMLESLPENCLVFDDLHWVTEPVVYASLDYLLERVPPHIHFIVATRHDPPLALARLRARGQLVELRLPDLRFTPTEASLFLNDKQHLALSPDDLARLQVRTEGWAAGLRLLAGSLERIGSAADRAAFIQTLADTPRYVFDFLADEVLKRQEPDTRTFLLETSILAEITRPLAQAVTGRSDTPSLLENLYRRNLFLVRVDETGPTFRYHALFAEFLRQQLECDMPDHLVELHRRAAEAQRATAPARAISHYLSAQLWAEAAQTIEQVGDVFIQQGLLGSLRGWLETLPPSIRQARPRLLYLLGLCALQRGELNEALTILDSARCGFETGDDPAGLAETLLLMIDAVSRQHDYARQAALTQQALALPLPVHGQVQLLMAQVWQSLFQRQIRQADEALDQALSLTLTSKDGRAFNVIAPILNMPLAFLPGGPARLDRYCQQVLSRFGHGVSAISAGTRALQSYLLLLQGAVDQAAAAANEVRAMGNQVGSLVYAEFQARYVQGLVAGVRGDYPRAEELWAEALPWLEQTPSVRPYVVAVLSFIGRAQWLQKKFDQARQTEVRIAAVVDPEEFPETTVTRHLMRALVEMTDRRFDQAERTLHQALLIEQRWPHAAIFGSPRLFLAYLHRQAKREKEAWAHFAPLLAECEQRHMPGLILQETQIAVPLLRLAVEKKAHLELAQRLLDILETAASAKAITVPDTGETLTPREVEILKLIGAGAGNRAIATQLVISEHTVKVHITRILAKLRVSSRTQAAARARELGLV